MQKIKIYVPLLDEGTATLREAFAVPEENGLYKLLAPADYDPADEYWDLPPGSLVRLEKQKMYDGSEGLVAKHPDPTLLHVFVESSQEQAPSLRETYARPIGDGLYQLLPTPHYVQAQLWKFPPGTIVRIEPMKTAVKNWRPWVAVERVE